MVFLYKISRRINQLCALWHWIGMHRYLRFQIYNACKHTKIPCSRPTRPIGYYFRLFLVLDVQLKRPLGLFPG